MDTTGPRTLWRVNVGHTLLIAMLATSAQLSGAQSAAPSVSQGATVLSIDEQELAPENRRALQRRIEQSKGGRIQLVSDDQIPDLEAAEADFRLRGKPLAELRRSGLVSSQAANVQSTPLGGAEVAGALPAGVRKGTSWSGLSRMFRHPTLGLVVLDEIDLASNGGGVIFTKELINADVNGSPAVLVGRQGSPKKALTTLTWVSQGVLYTLQTARVDDQARDELLNLARRLYR